MNEKDTKVPVYLAIIIALILVAAAGYYVLGGQLGETPIDDGKTPVVTPRETPATPVHPEGTSSVSPTTAPPQTSVATIKCELCHTDAQDLELHLTGGKICVNCHGSQVHSIHIGSGTIDLKCDSCHGSPQQIKIPTVEKGEGPGHFSVCEQCHAAPPDNLKPSNGNLVTIHLSRGKYCTNCHGTDVAIIHATALGKK
jgi:hypothetical protein